MSLEWLLIYTILADLSFNSSLLFAVYVFVLIEMCPSDEKYRTYLTNDFKFFSKLCLKSPSFWKILSPQISIEQGKEAAAWKSVGKNISGIFSLTFRWKKKKISEILSIFCSLFSFTAITPVLVFDAALKAHL